MGKFNPQIITNELLTSAGGVNTVSITPTSAAVIKASAGRLCKVLVTSDNGSTAAKIYDNATTNSGTIIGVIPASATAGQIFTFDMPALNGITCAATTNAGTFTVSFI